MAFNFVTEAWEDYYGNRYRGDPSTPATWGPAPRAQWGTENPRPVETVYGVFVRVYNPDTGETHRYWNFVYKPFHSWDEWYVYIGVLAGRHGMELE